MKYQMAQMLFFKDLEQDNVFRTKRDTRCLSVLLKRSTSLVLPVSLPTARWRLLGRTAA